MPRLFVPVLSPEHGAYIALVCSFLIGAIAAGAWNIATAVALVALLAGFQVPFPVTQMLRRGLARRLAFWAGLYGVLAAASGLWLIARVPALVRILWALVAVFGAAVLLGALRRYKALSQELVAFAGLALAAPWTETATLGFMPYDALGTWLVLAVAFWSAVFAVRVRSRGEIGAAPSIVASIGGLVVAVALTRSGVVSPRSLWLLAPGYARLAVVFLRPGWWRSLSIRAVGFIESGLAATMVALAAAVL